jgi:hypothetical protein
MEMEERLKILEEKVDKMYVSVEKLRKYFLWTVIITALLFILPLIGLLFAIPAFLHNYVGQINSLGGF